MWLKNFRQIVERLFCFKDRAPIHTRTMLTHIWNNPLSSCWPRWAELSVNWELCPRLGVERSRKWRERDLSDRWQTKPGRTRCLPPSSYDRFSLSRAFLGVLPPTPYHARSNLLFFLFSIVAGQRAQHINYLTEIPFSLPFDEYCEPPNFNTAVFSQKCSWLVANGEKNEMVTNQNGIETTN